MASGSPAPFISFLFKDGLSARVILENQIDDFSEADGHYLVTRTITLHTVMHEDSGSITCLASSNISNISNITIPSANTMFNLTVYGKTLHNCDKN